MGAGSPVLHRSSAAPKLMSAQPRAVATWLVANGEPVCGPVGIRRLGIGQSNITSIVADAAGREWVLREPPPGSKQGNAHAVAREAGVLAALDGSDIPVPRVVGIGKSRGGGSFFVMERVAGLSLEYEDDARALDPVQRYEIGLQVIRTLARLHRLDPARVRLAAPDTPYVERQVRRVSDTWLRVGSGCGHDAAWRAVRSRLLERTPQQQNPTVVMHGDFRLSNLLISDGGISAVLDWELCTVGDPLVDLAWLLDDWRSANETAISMPSPTRAGGFPTRWELIDIYRNETGFNISGIGYYRGLTQWRAASLLQGVLTRRRTGVMGVPDMGDLDFLDESIATLLRSAAVQLKEWP